METFDQKKRRLSGRVLYLEKYIDILSLADDVFKNESVKKEFVSNLKKKGINETEPLEHTYSSEWSYNDTKHYHACTDEGYSDLFKDLISSNLSSITAFSPLNIGTTSLLLK